jgi:hypothetical protein
LAPPARLRTNRKKLDAFGRPALFELERLSLTWPQVIDKNSLKIMKLARILDRSSLQLERNTR